MVEGYTDVIAMHQNGIENVVANSDTALSVYQIKLLRRFTQNITLLYDGDEAGIHAAMRGTDMLLAEGMKIKVLLLPDGDDPDSFAKKHSAQELKDYLEQNQTDFITFKTRLTVENVTDPVKRSEAIGGIVKSISMIPDQILRSTYISELAMRMDIKERTLLNTMNDIIRKDLDEKEREKEREAGRTEDKPSANTYVLSTMTPDAEVEQMIVQAIIRNGEKVIFENLATEDGGQINFTVAQYVDYDLGSDNIHFHDERYNQILAEAVEHSGEPDFVAETYFLHHPDVNISSLATNLAIDRHQLGKGFQLKEREGGLRQYVQHLVLDLRLDIVEKRLKELKTQMGKDMDKALMEEFRDTQQLRNALAQQLGNDLVG